MTPEKSHTNQEFAKQLSFLLSPRGRFIMAQAIYFLEQEMINRPVTKQELSNLKDAKEIATVLFQPYFDLRKSLWGSGKRAMSLRKENTT